jgi:hypothetical protein
MTLNHNYWRGYLWAVAVLWGVGIAIWELFGYGVFAVFVIAAGIAVTAIRFCRSFYRGWKGH